MKVNDVLQTLDYAIFQDLAGNRTINPLHVKRLQKSFSEEYLMCPIIVNERLEIIDGQHRFMAAKNIGLPINYIIVHGYRLPQVQRLNTSTKDWTKNDYLESYADRGYLPYVQMRKFMSEYPQLGLAAAECLLTQNRSGANNKGNDETGSKARNFQEGNLVVVDLEFAYESADYIMKIHPFYDGYNRAAFVRTISLLMQKPQFDIEYFIDKLEVNPGRFGHRNTIDEYIDLIEDVYNFRSRNKISLRY
jgi:hypothetical protein